MIVVTVDVRAFQKFRGRAWFNQQVHQVFVLNPFNSFQPDKSNLYSELASHSRSYGLTVLLSNKITVSLFSLSIFVNKHFKKFKVLWEHGTAVQLIFNPFSQFLPQLEL